MQEIILMFEMGLGRLEFKSLVCHSQNLQKEIVTCLRLSARMKIYIY